MEEIYRYVARRQRGGVYFTYRAVLRGGKWFLQMRTGEYGGDNLRDAEYEVRVRTLREREGRPPYDGPKLRLALPLAEGDQTIDPTAAHGSEDPP